MTLDAEILTGEEQLIFALRSLYRRAGYRLYQMSKFEEYDLYAGHKDFLISDNIITFTDAGGKLMALKPDVTLSIVRGDRDAPGIRKLCYDENVYRVSEHGGPFRELTQAGLECLGDVGEGELAEVLGLALESLRLVSAEYRLSVSHLGVLSALLDRLTVSGACRQEALRCAAQKNVHELSELCRAAGADPAGLAALERLLRTAGSPETVLPVLRTLGFSGPADELEVLAGRLDAGDRLRVDFSIVGNLNYYNGVVFKGYVEGASGSVLSGGQYDKLMRKLGRSGRAVGFAVYLDRLERLLEGNAPEVTV